MTLKVFHPQGFHVLFFPIARPLQAYFIINNRIYQSPDMYTVLSNRLARRPSLISLNFPDADGGETFS